MLKRLAISEKYDIIIKLFICKDRKDMN